MALKSTWRKVDELEANKQDELVSGVNIKTVNGSSLLGSGNLVVSGGGGISDGDKGDITVSGSGSVWTIDNSAVTNAKINDVAATKITEDSTHRFVTDTEKTTWNAKENAITAGTTSQYYRGDKTFQTLDKTAVGLSNVDNTSDANKPVSTAQATAIGLKQNTLVSGTNIKTINGSSVLGSGDLTVSASLPSGTVILLNANEVNDNGGTAFTVKSYTLGVNTYSRIIVEAEAEFFSGSNIFSTCDFAIYIGGVVKRIVENVNSATGSGDYIRTGIAIKYSEAITAGGLIELRTQNVSNATFVVNSLRIYGVI
jgi:hypothetical protein